MVTYQAKSRILIVVFLLSICTLVRAQNTLSQAANMLQPGDSVTKERVEYVHAGDTGKDVVWDFSNLEANDLYYIKYDTISHLQLVGYDTQKTYKYQTTVDGLLLRGYESPLMRMDFQQPQVILPLPMQFNQTMMTDYQGEGRYSGTHFERTAGTIRITADAEGTVILSEKDTLPNTLRVYSINTAAIRLNKDSCQNDEDNLKQVITEHYQWYARGYRYPVFETVTSSTYYNLDHIATQQYAYRCPPDIQVALNDTVNEAIRLSDLSLPYKGNKSEDGGGGQKPGRSGFTYTVNTNGNQAIITYNLENPATIHAMMVDVMGTIYRDLHQTNEAGVGHTMSIDCTGLRRGQYIIYMNVNGTIYHTKIPVK